jgi:hypothetical protein
MRTRKKRETTTDHGNELSCDEACVYRIVAPSNTLEGDRVDVCRREGSTEWKDEKKKNEQELKMEMSCK